MLTLSQSEWKQIEGVLTSMLRKHVREEDIEELLQETMLHLCAVSEQQEVPFPLALAKRIAHARLVDYVRVAHQRKTHLSVEGLAEVEERDEQRYKANVPDALLDKRDPEFLLIERALHMEIEESPICQEYIERVEQQEWGTMPVEGELVRKRRKREYDRIRKEVA